MPSSKRSSPGTTFTARPDRRDEADVDDGDHSAAEELGVRPLRRGKTRATSRFTEGDATERCRDPVDRAGRGDACSRSRAAGSGSQGCPVERRLEAFAPTGALRSRLRAQRRSRSRRPSCPAQPRAPAGRDTGRRGGSPPSARGRRRTTPASRAGRGRCCSRSRRRRAPRASVAVGDHHPPVAVAVDAPDGDPGPHIERVPARVRAQVLDDAVARGPLAVRARDPVPGQAGEPAHRVEVEAVVARLPGGADVVALQHHNRGPGTAERRRTGQPRAAGADDADHGRPSLDAGRRQHHLDVVGGVGEAELLVGADRGGVVGSDVEGDHVDPVVEQDAAEAAHAAVASPLPPSRRQRGDVAEACDAPRRATRRGHLRRRRARRHVGCRRSVRSRACAGWNHVPG